MSSVTSAGDVAGAVTVAVVVSCAIQPFLINGVGHRLVDHPTERSSHTVPTPRGGGIGVVGSAVMAFTLFARSRPAAAVVAALLLFAVVGLTEDLHGVPPFPRFGLQLLAGAGAALAVVSAARPAHAVLVLAVGALWLAAFANVFNFMDGINGISAAEGVVAGVAYAALGLARPEWELTLAGSVVAAAMVGFLPWNVPVARVFLGDVGSYAVGAALATLAALGLMAGLPVEACVAPLALYLADTTTTVLRRIRAGEPWHLPHRTHVYQRLTDLGWSHVQVTTLVASTVALTSALGALALHAWWLRGIGDVLIASVVTTYLQLPRLLRGRARIGHAG
ncbi:MAG: glycosyltransferase family 4 protein [Frankia sp.]|nr:glycosyltransferase family 4 protein [Frankia sp.]MCA1833587.1 glycosyltransferase family 4 protein [Actinomycetota bacterium]